MSGTGRAGVPEDAGSSDDAPALTHVDESGRARMVDVGDKDVTDRIARAACRVVVSPRTARLVATGGLPKGDVVTVARVAGVQAAKRTHELIPLCHALRITDVDVDVAVDPDAGHVDITSRVRARDRTGVEMEALTAVSVAALTVYDMVKAVERGARITEVRLLEKSGGRGGDWHADER